MNYGLYLSAAGALTSLHRQDVLANNLANLNTVGFKPDMVALRSRLPERLESGSAWSDPKWMLEQLGGGQFADATRVNLEQGDLAQTHNDLDVAIQGDGFFVVQKGRGPGAENTRFTRDGRFTLNSAGELTMAATGFRVLDVNDQPIRADRSAKIRIDGDGTVVQNNTPVARLQLSSVADASKIVKEGNNLLRFDGGEPSPPAKRIAANGTLHQGYIESSAVDPVLALNDMINASKAVQANITMMQYHDHILGQAVNTLGRVA